MKLLLIILLLTSGCASMTTFNTVIVHEPTAQEHVDSFLRLKREYLGTNIPYYDIEVRIGSLPGLKLAICEWTPSRTKLRTIILDGRSWFDLSDTGKEQLIYHEMGHCDLDVFHTPHGIMRPNPIEDSYYLSHRESHLRELFDLAPGSGEY